MRIILKGKGYDITREDIEAKLRAIPPEVGGKVKYFAEVEGKHFPVKQVLGQVLNLSRAGFTSQDAYGILQRLGFKITEKSLRQNKRG